MKKFALMLAAATCLLAAPALVQPAAAQADVNVRIGTSNNNGHHNGWRHRGYHSNAAVVVAHPRCRTVVTRTHRANGTVVIRKHRSC
jgi:ABC-type sugar transport system substrate-binding protein